MEIGLFAPLGNGNAIAEILRTLGREAEDRGFESIWVAEHVVMFDDYESQYPYAADGRFPGGGDTGLLEPLTALTYLAAVTDRIRLGTGICLVPQRNPVYTAKQVVDLDYLSGGRVDFGIGVGWLRRSSTRWRQPFEQRGARTDEYLQVMRSLWTDEVSSFEGEHYTLPECRMYPKPVQKPHPPIHVGGESNAALRRVARHGQGWYSFNRLPEPISTSRLPASTSCSPRRAAAAADLELTVSPVLPRGGRGRHRGVPRARRRSAGGALPGLRRRRPARPARRPRRERPRAVPRLTGPEATSSASSRRRSARLPRWPASASSNPAMA